MVISPHGSMFQVSLPPLGWCIIIEHFLFCSSSLTCVLFFFLLKVLSAHMIKRLGDGCVHLRYSTRTRISKVETAEWSLAIFLGDATTNELQRWFRMAFMNFRKVDVLVSVIGYPGDHAMLWYADHQWFADLVPPTLCT